MDYLFAGKVSRNSRRLAITFRIATALMLLCTIGLTVTAVFQPGALQWLAEDIYPQAGPQTMLQIRLLIGCILGQIALTLAALVSLERMFDRLATEDPLNHQAAIHMRWAGRWLLWATVYAMLVQIPASGVASFNLPEGQRFITLGLNWSHASGVLASLVLYAVASLQELAARMRDDDKQII